MVLAQSKEAGKAASEIRLVNDEGDHQLPTPQSEVEEKKQQVILPPGVRVPEGKKMVGSHHEVVVDEVPDDSERRVVPSRREEDMNKEGSFESIMRLASGGMKSNG